MTGKTDGRKTRSMQRLKVFEGYRGELMDLADNLAAIQLSTIGAGLVTSGDHAIPDLALITVPDLDAFFHAAGAVDHFRHDARHVVLYPPGFSNLRPQGIIVGKGGYPGFAGRAIQATAGNELIHCLSFEG